MLGISCMDELKGRAISTPGILLGSGETTSIGDPFRTTTSSLTDESPSLQGRMASDRNLFIFHLPLDWSEQELCDQFGKFGTIQSAKVIRRLDGVSKGYGFVCYDNAPSAQKAIAIMDGLLVPGGKKLSVALKRKREDCPNTTVEKLIQMHDQNKPFDRDRHCTVFIFHLPSSWSEAQLRNSFTQFGEVASCKVLLKPDGTSKGFGFVTYNNPKEAAQAIQSMDGFAAEGKRLKVQLKHTQTRQEYQPGGTIYVAHLPETWTDADLRRHFQHCGTIVQSAIMLDNETKSRSLGVGFVTFQTPAQAAQAIGGMNGFCVGTKKLRVSIKRGEEKFFNCFNDPSYQQAMLYGTAPRPSKRPNSLPNEANGGKYVRSAPDLTQSQQYLTPFVSPYGSMMASPASQASMPLMLVNNSQYLSHLHAMYPNSVPLSPYQTTVSSSDMWAGLAYGGVATSPMLTTTGTVSTTGLAAIQQKATGNSSAVSPSFGPTSQLASQYAGRLEDMRFVNKTSTARAPFLELIAVEGM